MAKRLLVVDDSAMIRAIICGAASQAGWIVVGEAENGQEAINRYEELRPDAMTLDLVMPEFDGRHALRRVRELDPEAKVVVVSALQRHDIIQQTAALGAVDFLVKPFDKRALIRTLNKLVEAPAAAS